jgi:DNA-binding transcriptional LysR family regulator
VTIDRLSQPLAFLYIEAVAECGSIRGAGEALNVASSGINRKILEYERSLGCQLFERLPRGVRLTVAGQKVLAHIRRERIAFERIKEEVNDLQGGVGGHIQIASVEVAPRVFLAKELAKFHKQFPKITYDIKIHGSKKVFDAVLAEEATVGLGINPPRSSRLLSLCSAACYIHAVVSARHPLAHKAHLTLSECAGFPLGLFDNTFGTYPILGAALQELLLEGQAVAYSNSLTVLTDLAVSSRMICFDIFPNLRKRQFRELVAVPISPSPFPQIALHLLVGAQRKLEAAPAAFAERVRATMTKMAEN